MLRKVNLTWCVFFVFFLCFSCGRAPDILGEQDSFDDDGADSASVSEVDIVDVEDPENETKDADSVPDDYKGGATDSDTDDVTIEEDSDGCPWECRVFAGANTCSSLGDHWVKNTEFECAYNNEICCQALGASDGLTENCVDQPAMNCAKSCLGTLVENPAYYCADATKVCCEDPAGPSYGCYDSGGTCVSPFANCPAGKVLSPQECPGLINIDKCCLEPVCPWSCEPDMGPRSCSSNVDNPTAVRNHNYSCDTPTDVCCQPLLPTDDGPPPEITDLCRGDMFCRASCRGFEKQITDNYCKRANLICCRDSRPPCDDIGGVCELAFLGKCSEGKEANDNGLCDNGLSTCCTPIDPSNTCALDGGRCVDFGSSCPTLYLPDLSRFCGFTLKTCCMPAVDFK